MFNNIVKSNLFFVEVNSRYKREIFIESIQMLLLFALTILVIYKLPKVFGYFLIIAIVFIFLGSKKDYFWFAYFLIIICCPGNFFIEGAFDAPYRLPLFSLGRNFSFSTHEVVMIVAFFKAIVSGRKYRYMLAKPLKLILFYALFLLILSILVYGSSYNNLTYFLRIFLFYSYLISFPFLIKKNEDIVKFIWLLFSIVFFTFFTAVYFFITGSHFLYFFDPGSLRELRMEGGELRFGMYGGEHILIIFCFIFSLSLSLLNNNRNLYLIIVGILSYLSILMTATRIWFVVFTLILITFLFKSLKAKKKGKVFIFLIILLSIAYIISNYNLSSISKIRDTSERLLSIFYIGEENSQSTQMLEFKAKSRLPIVLEGIKENPFFGWGFSDRASMVIDPDVGNFSLIAQVGAVGFLLFLYFCRCYFKIIDKTKRMLYKQNLFRNALLILKVSFIGFLIAQFTTHQFFGLTRATYYSFFISIFIFLSEFFVREALRSGEAHEN